jgi:uncharacterized membrane protein
MASETVTDPEPAGDSAQPAGQQVGDAGLNENVAGALSYLFGFLTGVLFFVIDDRPEVRFHAAQSVLLSVAAIGSFLLLTVLNTVLFASLFGGTFIVATVLWLLFSLVWLVVGVGGFVLWLYMMYSTYTGRTVALPVVGSLARSVASK